MLSRMREVGFSYIAFGADAGQAEARCNEPPAVCEMKRAHREGIRVLVVNEPGYSRRACMQSIIRLHVCQEFY